MCIISQGSLVSIQFGVLPDLFCLLHFQFFLEYGKGSGLDHSQVNVYSHSNTQLKNKNAVRRLLAYATKDTISLEQTNKMKASY